MCWCDKPLNRCRLPCKLSISSHPPMLATDQRIVAIASWRRLRLVIVRLAVPPADAAARPDDLAFFEKEVKPILVAKCLKCHSGENPKGKLQLTDRDTVLKGGVNG